MRTLAEVQTAANSLPTKEKWELFLFLAGKLRDGGQPVTTGGAALAAKPAPAAPAPAVVESGGPIQKQQAGLLKRLPPLQRLHRGISKLPGLVCPYTPAEFDAANDGWGFNDGPGTLATMLNLKPEDVRGHLGRFETKGY